MSFLKQTQTAVIGIALLTLVAAGTYILQLRVKTDSPLTAAVSGTACSYSCYNQKNPIVNCSGTPDCPAGYYCPMEVGNYAGTCVSGVTKTCPSSYSTCVAQNCGGPTVQQPSEGTTSCACKCGFFASNTPGVPGDPTTQQFWINRCANSCPLGTNVGVIISFQGAILEGTSGDITFLVSNYGDDLAADNVTLTINPPPSGSTWTYGSIPAGCTSINATSPITCVIGSMAADTSKSYKTTIVVPKRTTPNGRSCDTTCSSNISMASATTTSSNDTNPSDNSDTQTVGVQCRSCCGDGNPDTPNADGATEQCDDGNNEDFDTCTNQCVSLWCGDKKPGPNEECDDGNLINTDTCTMVCKNAKCGDQFVQAQAGEQCDEGANNATTTTCNPTCKCPAGMTPDGATGTCACPPPPTDPLAPKCESKDANGDGKIKDGTEAKITVAIGEKCNGYACYWATLPQCNQVAGHSCAQCPNPNPGPSAIKAKGPDGKDYWYDPGCACSGTAHGCTNGFYNYQDKDKKPVTVICVGQIGGTDSFCQFPGASTGGGSGGNTGTPPPAPLSPPSPPPPGGGSSTGGGSSQGGNTGTPPGGNPPASPTGGASGGAGETGGTTGGGTQPPCLYVGGGLYFYEGTEDLCTPTSSSSRSSSRSSSSSVTSGSSRSSSSRSSGSSSQLSSSLGSGSSRSASNSSSSVLSGSSRSSSQLSSVLGSGSSRSGSTSSQSNSSALSTSSSSASSLEASYCCIAGGCVQFEGCSMTQNACAASCILRSSSTSSTSSAVLVFNSCRGDECANGGNEFCSTTGQSCGSINGLPCIQCLGPILSSSSASSFTPSLELPDLPSLYTPTEIPLPRELLSAPLCFPNGSCTNPSDRCVQNHCLNVPQIASLPAFCGNGRLDSGERCDNGALNADESGATCRTDCTISRCGDGIVDLPAETCDAGSRNGAYDSGCDVRCQILRPAGEVLPGMVIELPFSPTQTIETNTPLTSSVLTAPEPPANVASGPGTIAIMAAGAAGGYAWVKRKRNRGVTK